MITSPLSFYCLLSDYSLFLIKKHIKTVILQDFDKYLFEKDKRVTIVFPKFAPELIAITLII